MKLILYLILECEKKEIIQKMLVIFKLAVPRIHWLLLKSTTTM